MHSKAQDRIVRGCFSITVQPCRSLARVMTKLFLVYGVAACFAIGCCT